jgi:hypothetical protein
LGVNVPDLYALLQRVHGVFERVAAITEKESNEHLLPTRFLMARAHAAWLAAVRLGMSGQVVETYPLVRMVVENSWYALHLGEGFGPSGARRAVATPQGPRKRARHARGVQAHDRLRRPPERARRSLA